MKSLRISDAEAVSMSRYLVKHDGLFLGSSSACNLIAAVKLAHKNNWSQGERIVTILYVLFIFDSSLVLILSFSCDSGTRHYSKFWCVLFTGNVPQRLTNGYFRNDEYLEKAGIPIDLSIVENLIANTTA